MEHLFVPNIQSRFLTEDSLKRCVSDVHDTKSQPNRQIKAGADRAARAVALNARLPIICDKAATFIS